MNEVFAKNSKIFCICFGIAFFYANKNLLAHENLLVRIKSGNYRPLYVEPQSNKTESPGDRKPKITRGEEIPVGAFEMDRFAVTREDFRKFVMNNLEWRRSKVKKIYADKSYLSDWMSDTEPGNTQSPKSPVRFVSWFSARAYCKSLNKRLPELAEWEYAAASYKNIKDLKKTILEWYSKPTTTKFADVGSTFSNDFGVYDLHGLIWEWVEDFNSSLVTGESRADGTLDSGAFCGSSGLGASNFEDYAAFMRFGFRSSLRGSFSLANLGFRCARNIGGSRDR